MVGSASASFTSDARSIDAEAPPSINTVAKVPTRLIESRFWSSVLSKIAATSTVAEAPFWIFTVIVESAFKTTELIS